MWQAAAAYLSRPFLSQFPFAITTLNNSNPLDIQSGAITTVAADAAYVLYSGGYKVFYGTITATDKYGYSGSGPLQIWVLWVRQPPYFNTATRAPASASFALSMLQHTAPGTRISNSPLLGYSKDPWQTPALRYAWDPVLTAPATAALFTVNAISGDVSLALSE